MPKIILLSVQKEVDIVCEIKTFDGICTLFMKVIRVVIAKLLVDVPVYRRELGARGCRLPAKCMNTCYFHYVPEVRSSVNC